MGAVSLLLGRNYHGNSAIYLELTDNLKECTKTHHSHTVGNISYEEDMKREMPQLFVGMKMS